MADIEVLLVVAVHDFTVDLNERMKFLLVRRHDGQPALPSVELGPLSSIEHAASLLTALTGAQTRGGLQPKPYPLADSPDRKRDGVRLIGVPFLAVLPYLVEPKPPLWAWYSFQQITEAQPLYMDHFEILTTVLNGRVDY